VRGRGDKGEGQAGKRERKFLGKRKEEDR